MVCFHPIKCLEVLRLLRGAKNFPLEMQIDGCEQFCFLSIIYEKLALFRFHWALLCIYLYIFFPQKLFFNSYFAFLKSGRWSEVSNEAKMLVADMLHVKPERRPTAAYLSKHPWINMRYNCQMVPPATQHHANQSQPQMPIADQQHLKERVAATYRAITTTQNVANLGPVGMSDLARRRFRDKALNRVQEQARNEF